MTGWALAYLGIPDCATPNQAAAGVAGRGHPGNGLVTVKHPVDLLSAKRNLTPLEIVVEVDQMDGLAVVSLDVHPMPGHDDVFRNGSSCEGTNFTSCSNFST